MEIHYFTSIIYFNMGLKNNMLFILSFASGPQVFNTGTMKFTYTFYHLISNSLKVGKDPLRGCRSLSFYRNISLFQCIFLNKIEF